MRNAFTLIELLVVLLLLSLLLSIVAPQGAKILEGTHVLIDKKDKETEKKIGFFEAFLKENKDFIKNYEQ